MHKTNHLQQRHALCPKKVLGTCQMSLIEFSLQLNPA